MRSTLRILVALLNLITASAALALGDEITASPTTRHTTESDKRESCPHCGPSPGENDSRFRVAVLLFNQAEDIDFTAPIEILGHTGAQVFTVAATKDPIDTVFGLHLRPDYDFEHAPSADLILVPGGNIEETVHSEVTLSWLRERAATAQYVMSVCNGAFILARAGLLEGLKATTTATRIDQLAAAAPKTLVIRERYVDNGKIITTAGLSAGIDGSLHVIERQFGRTRAEEIARAIEYRWDPTSQWTRARDAELQLPLVHLPEGASWETLSSAGNTDRWTMRGRLLIGMSQDEALDFVNGRSVENGWTPRSSGKATRSWTRTDRDGQAWLATLESSPDGAPSTYLMTLNVRKTAPTR